MRDRVILLRKKTMKNGTGLSLSLLAERLGFLDLSAFSAKRPSRTYLGLDYFRVLEVDFKKYKEEYRIDSILKIKEDFSLEFIKNKKAYKSLFYIQQVLIKVLLPLSGHLSSEGREKIFSNFIYLLKNLTHCSDDKRLITIVYRFLQSIYLESGFTDEIVKDLSVVMMLDRINKFHKSFLDNSIKLFEI